MGKKRLKFKVYDSHGTIDKGEFTVERIRSAIKKLL